MASVDDITISYREDDIEVVKELDKKILTKGAWATVMFKYQEWNKTTQAYGPAKFAIRRYQKRNDKYMVQSKFTISSVDQAQKIVDALNEWIAQADAAVE